jgi:selenocysteine lyase/cysteine desulfurase
MDTPLNFCCKSTKSPQLRVNLIDMSLRETDNFPYLEDKIWFNNAGQGVTPKSTTKIVEEYLADFCCVMRGEKPSGTDYGEVRVNSKNLFAEVIGADASEIAFVPNATTGINTAFSMIPFEKGDNVVLSDLSYPMGAMVVNRQRLNGVKPRFVKNVEGEVDISEWEKAIDDSTKAVMVDQTAWLNGYLYDLKPIAEIAHDHGAYLVIDGTQSAGGHVWDVHGEGVDFLATSTYKWLLGSPYPNNVGFLYVREEHIEGLQPEYVGSQTLPPDVEKANQEDAFTLFDYQSRNDIGKVEVYSQSQLGYVMVENSMKVLLKHGLERVEKQIRKVDTRIIDGLTEMGVKIKTPLDESKRLYLNALVPNYKEVCAELAKQNVFISPRIGGLRISPGAFNEVSEADEFLEKLKPYV